jgi:hypothetical protein
MIESTREYLASLIMLLFRSAPLTGPELAVHADLLNQPVMWGTGKLSWSFNLYCQNWYSSFLLWVEITES